MLVPVNFATWPSPRQRAGHEPSNSEQEDNAAMSDDRTEHEECRSFVAGSLTCRDGFVQKAYCRGYGGCLSCGHISDAAVPGCLRDEIAPHLLRENGAPLFYSVIP